MTRSAPTRSGMPCRAQRMKNKQTCILHSSPAIARQLGSVGARQRNMARQSAATLCNFPPPEKADEVRVVLSHVLVEVRVGRVDARTGNAVAALASILLKAINDTNFEARLTAIETKLRENGKGLFTT